MRRASVTCISVLLVISTFLVGGCGSKTSSKSSSGTSPSSKTVTKKQVEAFVNEAIDYGRANGREKAVAEFNNPKGSFVRGELYIYAYDWNGVALANGGNPSLAGKNLIDMKDSNGVMVIQDLMKAARAGGGWVSFMWPYPGTKIEEPKLGYAKSVDDTWWLGSGMYEKTP